MLAAVLLVLASCSQRGAPRPIGPPEPPSSAGATKSVLIIITDDLGWSEWPLLPSVQGLAASGTLFRRAYGMPVCSITRLSIMYGHLPRRDSIGWTELAPDGPLHQRLPLENLSIAEVFKPTHWTGYTGKWHLGRAPLYNGLGAGLTASELTAAQTGMGAYCQGWDAMPGGNPSALGAGGYYSWREIVDGQIVTQTKYATLDQREKFQAWWTSTPGPKLGIFAPNAPHETGIQSPLTGEGFEPPPGYDWNDTVRQDYENIVSYLDGQIAQLLTVVDFQETFVVFASDNGTPQAALPPEAEPGTGKTTTRENGIRLPLVIAGGGVPIAQTDRLVSLMDLGPTLAEMVGLPTPRLFEDACSFADEVGAWDGEPARSWVFSEGYSTADPAGVGPINYDDQCIVEAAWKMRIVDPDGAGLEPPATYWYLIDMPGHELPAGQPPAGVLARFSANLASLPPRVP